MQSKQTERTIIFIGEDHGEGSKKEQSFRIEEMQRNNGGRQIILVHEALPEDVHKLFDKPQGVTEMLGIEQRDIEKDFHKKVYGYYIYQYYLDKMYEKSPSVFGFKPGYYVLPFPNLNDFMSKTPSEMAGIIGECEKRYGKWSDTLPSFEDFMSKTSDEMYDTIAECEKKYGRWSNTIEAQKICPALTSHKGLPYGGSWAFSYLSKHAPRLPENVGWHKFLLQVAKNNPQADFICVLGAAHVGTSFESGGSKSKYKGMIELFREEPGSFTKVAWEFTKPPSKYMSKITYPSDSEQKGELELQLSLESTYHN